MKEKIRQEIIDRLLASDHVLITAHRSPDGDSIGSQLGLAGFLEARNIPFMMVNEGDIPEKYRFLPGIELIRDISGVAQVDRPFDTAVVIECSNLDRIGGVRRLIGDDTVIINIDHHPDNISFGDIDFTDTSASAAGEMIFDILCQVSAEIDAAMATNLYTAILTDTGRFHFSSTTPYCLQVAGQLLSLGADPVEITEKIYFNLRPQVVRLTGMAVANMQLMLGGRLCVLSVDRAMMKQAGAGGGDTEGLVNYSMYSGGVEVGVLFTEVEDNQTKVSFRSQNDIDVAGIAAHYGGGGHINASGCVVELPLERAREKIVAFIKERLNGSV
jgi:phosphoesterase RecJ-like protein